MLNFLHPSFEGIYKPDNLSPRFIDKIASRIQSTGLLPKAAKGRNQYEIVERTDHSLRLKAVGLLTGINVGLNDVSLQVNNSNGEVHYRISYWTWAGYCVFLGIVIGIFFILVEFIFPADWYPPELIKKYIFYPFVGFWC